jgi:hypothetical protein
MIPAILNWIAGFPFNRDLKNSLKEYKTMKDILLNIGATILLLMAMIGLILCFAG